MSSKIVGIRLHLSTKRVGGSIYLEIVNNFFKYSKNYNWNVVTNDVKLKVGWSKKKGFLLVIQLVMDEINYFKLKRLNTLSSLDALNWPINISNSYRLIQMKFPQLKLLECIWLANVHVNNSCKLNHSNKSRFSSALNDQYMKVVISNWDTLTNETLWVHSIHP